MKFIDDYRLLAVFQASWTEPPSVVLINTEKEVGEIPLKTAFQLPPYNVIYGPIYLHLEQDAHEPSSAESLAPFYRDPSQRIAVLDVERTHYHFVVQIGALLEFENLGRSEIGWDEWKGFVATPHTYLEHLKRSHLWVTGSRLFSIYQLDHSSLVCMQVHDFGQRGRARYLRDSVDERLGGVRCLSPTGTRTQIPWTGRLGSCSGGHDSLLFLSVSAIALCFI